MTDIAHRRLDAQRLTRPSLETAVDVVRLLGAVQAQDYPAAKWAIGLRARALTDADVERAMTDGSILRTHVLRPTWHFVTPADIRWMLALTGPRVNAAMASYDRRMGLDATLFERSNATVADALRGGTQATRAELATALRSAGIDTSGTHRLARLVMHAELDGIICSGAVRGKQFTYALLDERAPAMAPVARDDALLELTTRYFATRGPATVNDFAWWSGLTVREATQGIQLAAARLDRDVIDGKTYWLDPSAPVHRVESPTAYLLPNYDEYFIGFKDRSAIGRRLGTTGLVTGGSTLIAHVVIVDGQLVGGWRRTTTPDKVIIDLHLPVRLSSAEAEAVERAAASLERFLAQPVELRGLKAPRRRW